MFRRLVCALFVLMLTVGIALAAEMRGVITKVEGDKITFVEVKGKEKGAAKTYTVADNVKIFKGKFNKDTKKVEAGDAIAGGLKAGVFSKIGEKGVAAAIVTDAGDKVTEIRVTGGGKKKAK